MAHTKRNDDRGYERGARGIDGRDGENFVSWGSLSNAGKVSGEDGGAACGAGKSVGELQRSAKGK